MTGILTGRFMVLPGSPPPSRLLRERQEGLYVERLGQDGQRTLPPGLLHEMVAGICRHQDHLRRRKDRLQRLERLHAVDPGHHDVHEDRPEAVLPDNLDRRVARVRGGDAVRLGREDVGQGLHRSWIVVHHEHQARRHGRHSSFVFWGKTTRKRLPRPTALSTLIVPPLASASPCATARPSPIPLALVVKSGWKIFSRFSGAIPTPVSNTATRPPPSARAVSIVRVPPSGMAWAPLVIRLPSTCWI